MYNGATRGIKFYGIRARSKSYWCIDNIPSTRNPRRTKQTACPNRRSRNARVSVSVIKYISISVPPKYCSIVREKQRGHPFPRPEQNKYVSRIAKEGGRKRRREGEELFFRLYRTLTATPAAVTSRLVIKQRAKS